MNLVELLALSLVLATDAALYAFSYSLTLRQRRCAAAWQLAASTALFQAIMPLFGYLAGEGLLVLVADVASWVICVIFCTLGVVTICRRNEEQAVVRLRFTGILLVAFATSIDAFASGICFAMARESFSRLFWAVSCIGGVTLFSVLFCFYLASFCHRLPEKILQRFSGAIFIALGLLQLL